MLRLLLLCPQIIFGQICSHFSMMRCFLRNLDPILCHVWQGTYNCAELSQILQYSFQLFLLYANFICFCYCEVFNFDKIWNPNEIVVFLQTVNIQTLPSWFVPNKHSICFKSNFKSVLWYFLPGYNSSRMDTGQM